MNRYRYSLEKGSKKHVCPKCNEKRFVRYVNANTGDYLPEHYGRCDRESKCGYHRNPYHNGYAKAAHELEKGYDTEGPRYWNLQRTAIPPKQFRQTVFFDFDTFKQTLNYYEKNVFIRNLLSRVPYPFGAEDVTRIIELYRLGTVADGYRAGAITFPFIDIAGNVRAVQVKQFDHDNRTIKNGTDFLHSIIGRDHTRNNKQLPQWLEAYGQQEKRVSCLFGEHLLNKYPNNSVALVEAPKTAIYGTLYFGLPKTPENWIWLAVYNKSSFTFEKLKVLQGRQVYVFPDLSKNGDTFRDWQAKAQSFESQLSGTRLIFSDLLEKSAPEADKVKGYDLADYLIRQDWRLFRSRK